MARSRKWWRAFRRWPTWVQVLAWVFYGWIVIPLAILGGALTKGTFTPEEAAERARARTADRIATERISTKPVVAALTIVVYCGLTAVIVLLVLTNSGSPASPVFVVAAVLWFAMQPAAAYAIGRRWALWLPGISLFAALIWVYTAGTPQVQTNAENAANGLGFFWIIGILLMAPGLFVRRYLYRRSLRLRPEPSFAVATTGLPPPPVAPPVQVGPAVGPEAPRVAGVTWLSVSADYLWGRSEGPRRNATYFIYRRDALVPLEIFPRERVEEGKKRFRELAGTWRSAGA